MIIGMRTLTVATADGERAVQVTLFAPISDGPAWYCHYEIDWPEGVSKSRAMGNDALHAIHMAQEKLATDLYMSRYHHERTMWWIKPWVGYGFALPKGARELAIGHDREFYGDA